MGRNNYYIDIVNLNFIIIIIDIDVDVKFMVLSFVLNFMNIILTNLISIFNVLVIN